jgi:lipoyl-dependent peroxiredoxin
MSRHATAVWNGSIKEGKGHISTQSGVLEKTQYSFKSRFEEGAGTNPEELIAAAHAGCFSMKLSADLGSAGFTAEEIQTTANIKLDNGIITRSDLVLKAKIPGISEEEFLRIAEGAKKDCPVSKALDMKISLEAKLVQ